LKDEKFIIDLFRKPELNEKFNGLLSTQKDDATIDGWIIAQGYKTTLSKFLVTLNDLCASQLFPWIGNYSSDDKKTVLTISSSPKNVFSPIIYINSVLVNKFTFNNFILKWVISDKNKSNGMFKFCLNLNTTNPSEPLRAVEGKLWTEESEPII